MHRFANRPKHPKRRKCVPFCVRSTSTTLTFVSGLFLLPLSSPLLGRLKVSFKNKKSRSVGAIGVLSSLSIHPQNNLYFPTFSLSHKYTQTHSHTLAALCLVFFFGFALYSLLPSPPKWGRRAIQTGTTTWTSDRSDFCWALVRTNSCEGVDLAYLPSVGCCFAIKYYRTVRSVLYPLACVFVCIFSVRV